MKRYRILQFDFDSRPHFMTQEINDAWADEVKALHRQNRADIEHGLLLEFGEVHAGQKRQNFIDLGAKPFSVLAFHNRFLHQIREAFVVCAYYPALTGACASANAY